MPDIAHLCGGDAEWSATGDILLSAGSQMSKERVLRRLLTNPGDYLWHPRYGAGLPREVGAVADEPRLAAVIRRQMRQERGVLQEVPPDVTVNVGADGTVTARIRYADSETGEPVALET